MEKGYLANTKSKLVGLIGNPLDHSVSPLIHNALYKYYNINAVYIPFTIRKNELEKFIETAKFLKFSGFGVTMPFKNMIHEYVDDAEESAKTFNCINQVSIAKDGSTYGYSTDGYGLCQAVENTGYLIKDKTVLILGAGSIAGIVGFELAKRGVKKVIILNRSLPKAEILAQKLSQFAGVPSEYGSLTSDELKEAAEKSNIVLQCTSLGMYGEENDFEDLSFINYLPSDAICADSIYNPIWTQFLSRARDAGLKTVSGINMFTQQISRNIEYNIGFTGVEEKGIKYAEQLMNKALKGYDVF